MKPNETKSVLASMIEAAQVAGELIRKNLHSKKKVNSSEQHDIKLELDVRCQTLIERHLARRFPQVAVLGEEGESGATDAELRWVIDPIDGTVNFAHGIPHACVSIALQARLAQQPSASRKRLRSVASHPDDQYESIVGVVYDPFCGELWTAIRGKPANLNGRRIRVSSRRKLDESIISIGFAKSAETLEVMLPRMNRLVRKVRKIRLMGSAALAMTYVASGRFDAYIEHGISLWDVAAGGLILECAGGEFWREPAPGEHKFCVVANNGLLRRPLERAW